MGIGHYEIFGDQDADGLFQDTVGTTADTFFVVTEEELNYRYFYRVKGVLEIP